MFKSNEDPILMHLVPKHEPYPKTVRDRQIGFTVLCGQMRREYPDECKKVRFKQVNYTLGDIEVPYLGIFYDPDENESIEAGRKLADEFPNQWDEVSISELRKADYSPELIRLRQPVQKELIG